MSCTFGKNMKEMAFQTFSCCLLLTYYISLIEGTTVFCDLNKHVFYSPQGDFCRSCDKCLPGYELQSLKELPISVDPMHGAMDCQKCIRCKDGFYSTSFSYDDCKPCRKCDIEGKVELLQCSWKKNSECGGKFFKSIPSTNESVTEAEKTVKTLMKATNIEQIVLIVVFSVIGVCSMFGLLHVIHGCLKSRNKHVEQPAQTTEVSSREFREETSVMVDPNQIETDSGLCNITVAEKLLQVGCDAMTEKLCMNFSKLIAPDNIFHMLGLQLGVPDIDISIIKENYRHSVQEQAYQTLLKWRQLKGDNACIADVLRCLITIERQDIVEKFRIFNS